MLALWVSYITYIYIYIISVDLSRDPITIIGLSTAKNSTRLTLVVFFVFFFLIFDSAVHRGRDVQSFRKRMLKIIVDTGVHIFSYFTVV